MRKRLTAAGWMGAGVVATIAVMAVQASGVAAASDTAQGPLFQMIHAGCAGGQADSGQAAASHVPNHLATVLELSNAQVAEMDAIAAEACNTLEQIHGRMSGVLTPEQLEKAQAMHGSAHGHSGMGALFRKLHGGN